MSEIITTLHKKDDASVEVYPNIKADNIPNASITSDKIASGAIGTTKLATDAVTSAKINNGAVGTDKISDLAVTGEKIATGTISYGKLDDDLKNIINTLNLYIHTIYFSLKDVNNETVSFCIQALTIGDDTINNTLNDFMEFLRDHSCINKPMIRINNDTFAHINELDFGNNTITIYEDRNGSGTSDYIYNTLISLNDNIDPVR